MSFGDVQEDGVDLEDIVKVRLDPRAPFQDLISLDLLCAAVHLGTNLVLIARDLKALFGFLQTHQGNVGQLDLV